MRNQHLFLQLLLLCGLAIFLATSCKSSESNEKTAMEQSDQPGPPPGNRPGPPPGDRPGPPHGGGNHSPEQTKTLEEIGGYQLGAIAADFNLKDVSGRMVSLAGIPDAKGYVVVFTCNECPFAKMYEDRLIALHNEWAPKGYPVVTINSNGGEGQESFAAMQSRASDKKFPFTYLLDEEQKFSPLYGAVRTPHVFVLDQTRTVRYIGAIDDNARSEADVKTKYVEEALKALSTGKSPTISYTKAIGCPIRHKA